MKIGFMGLGGITETDNVAKILEKSGHNLGNFLFFETSKKLIDNELTTFEDSVLDVLFFTCANWLNENDFLEPLTEIIIKKDVPCICVGLGAQSDSFETMHVLKHSTIRFLQEISKRTPYILVRGEYSQKVCNHYNIQNVKVGGCPSIFLNDNMHLGEILETNYQKEINNLCLNMDFNRNRIVIDEYKQYFKKYILQNEEYLMQIIKNENIDEHILQKSNNFKCIDEYKQYIQDNMVFFPNIEDWSNYIKTFDHAIGDRIHGNIICLQNEVPVLCVTIDTRTKELCDSLLIPNIPFEEYKSYNIENIKNIQFDGKLFDENRRKLAFIYIELFEKVGLKVSDKLLKFIN